MDEFYGTYEHVIDGKGRLVMPSSYRSAFTEGGIAALVEDYAAFITNRDEMMRQLRDLAGAIDAMMQRVEVNDEALH